MRSLCTTTREQPPFSTTRESLHTAMKTQHSPQNKKHRIQFLPNLWTTELTLLNEINVNQSDSYLWSKRTMSISYKKSVSLLDHWKSKRVLKKRLLLLYWLCQRLWLCESQKTGKFFKRWEYQTALPASWETCMQVKKSQLEPDMEQQTGSK